MNALNRRHLSPAERRRELCTILALGLVRLRHAQSSKVFDDEGESSLEQAPTLLARELDARGMTTRHGNRIDKKYLYRMLSNRAYIGEAVHKGDSYPGEHDAMIDRETWDRVHSILTESPRKRAARTRADTPALLKGLLFGPDDAAFSPTHTRKGGRLYRYYVSQTVLKHGAGSCPVGRVPAGEIEAAVIDQLRALFRQPEIVAGTWKAARGHVDDITEADASAALTQLDPLWDELFPAEQARIVALLVERVDIGPDGSASGSGWTGSAVLPGTCKVTWEKPREPRGGDPRDGDAPCPVPRGEAWRAERDAASGGGLTAAKN